LISRLLKEPPITGHSRKGSIPGTAGDSRSNETGGNELSDHAQEQTNAYRSHEHATCQARRDHADTSVADDADGRKGNEGSGTEKTTDPDGSGADGESENKAPEIAAEAAGCPKYRALVSGVGVPIKVPKLGHPSSVGRPNRPSAPHRSAKILDLVRQFGRKRHAGRLFRAPGNLFIASCFGAALR
jgi:hypothetical protein